MTDSIEHTFPPRPIWPLLQVEGDWSCPGGGVHEWTGDRLTGGDGMTIAVATTCGKCPAKRMEFIHVR
jgi:hypothetical protein